MLLRLRNLPPKTGQSDEGHLAVIKDYHMLDGRPQDHQLATQTEVAAAWLDPMQLSPGGLIAIRDGPMPSTVNGLAAWDLRFIARILLADGTM